MLLKIIIVVLIIYFNILYLFLTFDSYNFVSLFVNFSFLRLIMIISIILLKKFFLLSVIECKEELILKIIRIRDILLVFSAIFVSFLFVCFIALSRCSCSLLSRACRSSLISQPQRTSAYLYSLNRQAVQKDFRKLLVFSW